LTTRETEKKTGCATICTEIGQRVESRKLRALSINGNACSMKLNISILK